MSFIVFVLMTTNFNLGDDLIQGGRCHIDLQCLRNLTTDGHSAAYEKLFLIQKQLESHYRDMQVLTLFYLSRLTSAL